MIIINNQLKQRQSKSNKTVILYFKDQLILFENAKRYLMMKWKRAQDVPFHQKVCIAALIVFLYKKTKQTSII